MEDNGRSSKVKEVDWLELGVLVEVVNFRFFLIRISRASDTNFASEDGTCKNEFSIFEHGILSSDAQEFLNLKFKRLYSDCTTTTSDRYSLL